MDYSGYRDKKEDFHGGLLASSASSRPPLGGSKTGAFSNVPISFTLFGFLLLSLAGCFQKENKEKLTMESTSTTAAAPSELDIEESTPSDYRLNLPPNFGRWTGDWDEIRKRNFLRLLVVYSKTSFYYDRAHPSGLNSAVARELEVYINKKLKTGAKKFQVALIPVTTGQLLPDLNNGMGDIIAASVFVNPEREKIVDFTQPIITGARLIVVTNKEAPPVASIADLSGRQVVVNKARTSYSLLLEESQKLKQAGKPEIKVVESDPALLEEDLLEMTNAGLIPVTVCWDKKAEVWSSVLPNLTLNSDAVLKDGGDLAWAMRKNSPRLKALLDDFFKTRREGTAFGRIMAQHYLSVEAVKHSTSRQELQKFRSYVRFFQKYAQQYDFDYLMIAAQAYQESTLRQDLVSPRGAVGIMQVIPRMAAARPIGIPDVYNAEQNIHAGTKMLAQISETYFNDPGIDRMNKTLFAFAAYDAGPSRINHLRREAHEQGLDPNKWFGNVELVAAKDIGQETVQYVSNIYKYYVAYKMVKEKDLLPH
jgi:membrane-bound lytic murein transglycosylase MltF